MAADIILTQPFKCPHCKHAILLTNADFIEGIAMISCSDCGRDAFAIELLVKE